MLTIQQVLSQVFSSITTSHLQRILAKTDLVEKHVGNLTENFLKTPENYNQARKAIIKARNGDFSGLQDLRSMISDFIRSQGTNPDGFSYYSSLENLDTNELTWRSVLSGLLESLKPEAEQGLLRDFSSN